MQAKKIKAKYVSYCLLNYKKKQNSNEWEYDYGPWYDKQIPQNQMKNYNSMVDFHRALQQYEKLLRGYSMKANELWLTTKLGHRSGILFEQLTMNFPEVFIFQGDVRLNWKLKREREFKAIKNKFEYLPWRQPDEM
jgi:hypothetical protein